jgi:CheY-like chemotaxis protein
LKKTLLLADDSPTIQKVINLTFADEGIDVIAVSDGNAAIQQLREMTPDLVMVDVHMPGLNGYQICERLRQNAELKNVPVILLVGSFEPFDEEEAKRVGADDFLMKPFQSIRQLVSRVGALLEPPQQEPAQPEVVGSVEPEVETPGPEATENVETHTTETAPEAAPVVGEYSDLGDELLSETVPGDAVAAGFSSQEVFDEEDDDLLNFDREFDKKFPDAASLSSEQIDSVGFAQPEQNYSPLQDTSPVQDISPVQYTSPVQDISYGETPVQHEDEVSTVEENYEETSSQTAQHEEEVSLAEESYAETAAQTAQLDDAVSLPEENTETQPFPEDDLNRIVALQQPERISDEVEEKSIELVVPEASENSSILDLGNLGRFFEARGITEERRESDVLLDIDTGETAAAEEERYVTPITEAVDEIVAEKMVEVSGETASGEVTFEETKYDFRSPDAFDEDADIEETFHGLAEVEEEPAPVFQSPQAPLERVVDEDVKPGNVSEDQADGFSGLTVPPVSADVPQEAIDAAAQKVFEQISEKVVTEMVRGLMPQIRDLVAREIAKENE